MHTDTRPIFVGAWFGLAISTLIFALLFLFYISHAQVVQVRSQSFGLYAALPRDTPLQTLSITPSDARAKIIEDFFKGYESPLSLYAKKFVAVSDSYNLDWRLLPAISMQESVGGKITVNGSHNPFGYGIYGNLVIKFASWEEGIEKVGKALRVDYLDLGLKTPSQIMTKYTPPSLAKGGSWAKGVSSFIEELR